MARLLFGLLLAAPATAQSDGDGYELGHGLRISDTGWNVGGYATGVLDYPHGRDPQLDLSHLSLFFWWESEDKFKFFSELDWEHTLTTQSSPLGTDREYLALERLYIDYAYDESINLRAGKFLTAIGRWNLVHADPLVWTTSRPLVTQAVFPTNATGAMVFGTVNALGRGIDYALYASTGNDIRPKPRSNPFKNAFGARASLPLTGNSQWGFSYANFEQTLGRSDRKTLLGTDFVWTRNRFELSGEAVYRFSDKSSRLDRKGFYLQAVAPLSGRLYGVVRFEPFSFNAKSSSRTWVAGVNFRINPALVIKGEFIRVDRDRPYLHNGFVSSVSVLF